MILFVFDNNIHVTYFRSAQGKAGFQQIETPKTIPEIGMNNELCLVPPTNNPTSHIPWQVYFVSNMEFPDKICEGTILDHKTVLTSADCGNLIKHTGNDDSNFFVYAGFKDITAPDITRTTSASQV